jgi:hypothetical protein
MMRMMPLVSATALSVSASVPVMALAPHYGGSPAALCEAVCQ